MKTWQEAAAHSWYILSNLTPLASHFQEPEPVSSWKTPGVFFTEGLKYLLSAVMAVITTVTFTTWHSWVSLRWRQLQLLSVGLSGWRAKGVKTSQMTLKPFCLRSDQLYMKSYTYCWSVGLFLPKLGCIMCHIWFGDSQNFICSKWERHPCDSTARGVSIWEQSHFFYPLVSLS